MDSVRRELESLVDGAQQDSDRLRDAVAQSSFAVLVANDHGDFLMVNEAAITLTGYSRVELARLTVWQLTPDVHEREAETLWRAFLQQREQFGTYRVLRKDGTTIVAPYAAKTNVVRGHHVSVLGEALESANVSNR
jgi:PAS domain S-box-containing protein